MSCSHWHRLIALEVGGDLDPRLCRSLEKHLEGCAACRDLAGELRSQREALLRLDREAKDGVVLGSVRHAVLADLADRRWPFFRLPAGGQRVAIAVAAAGILVVTSIVLRSERAPTEPIVAERRIPTAVLQPTTEAIPSPTTDVPVEPPRVMSPEAPVPEINVELTVYFLMATKEGPPSTSVPADLDGVAVQLQEVFGYTSVRLIEVTAIRVRNGSQGKINGILPQRLADDREARYEFFFDKLQVTEDSSGRSIRLDRLNAGVQAPHTVVEGGQATTRYMQTGIQTDIDLREGQKAVIGKTSIEGGAETVFVVVTGTIVD